MEKLGLGFEKELLKNEELQKLLEADQIKAAFDETVQSFTETVRNAIESMKTEIERKNKIIKDEVKLYEEGVKIIEKEAEEQVLSILQSYYSKKKKIEQKREDEGGPEWDEKLFNLKEEILVIDDQLMEIEMTCHERLVEQCDAIINRVKGLVNEIELELSNT